MKKKPYIKKDREGNKEKTIKNATVIMPKQIRLAQS